MHPKLKYLLSEAIQGCLDKVCESDDHLWSELIHDELVFDMTEAAALVFDTAQQAQAFYRREGLT